MSSRPRSPRLSGNARGQCERRQRQHTARSEHAAPAQRLQQQAREQRPQRQARTECRAQQGEDTGTPRSLPALRQRSGARGQRCGGGNALQAARQIQPQQRRRQAYSGRRDGEAGRAQQEHPPSAMAISQATGSEQQAAEGEHEGVGHPGQRSGRCHCGAGQHRHRDGAGGEGQRQRQRGQANRKQRPALRRLGRYREHRNRGHAGLHPSGALMMSGPLFLKNRLYGR